MASKRQKQGKLEQCLSGSFDKLRSNVGKKVRVEYVWYGQPHFEESTLRSVDDYVNIAIEGSGIPFIGYGSAIRRITDAKGNVLYDNPNIPNNYDIRINEEREDLVALSFGKDVAKRFRDERIKGDKEWQERKAKLDAEARTKTNSYLKQGRPLVRKDTLTEWQTYVTKNTQDAYSAGVVDASIRVMKVLSDGKTPKEAEQVIYGMDITGFMAGCMAQAVSHFHPRGEEFRKYWNRQYMGKKEAESSKGVVNPAILKIRAS